MRSLRLGLAGATAFVLGLGLSAMVYWPDLRPAHKAGWPPELLSPPCAEAAVPDQTAPFRLLGTGTGPEGAPAPSRTVELRSQTQRDGRIVVWAEFTVSTSDLDRVWLDWIYRQDYDDVSQLRQCGPQPVTWSPRTPAVSSDGTAERPRWFRACGQVPPKDRAPGKGGLVCTGWFRP